MEIDIQINSCRICLKNVGVLPFFSDNGEGIAAELISSLFNIDVIRDIKLPDSVCTTCMENIIIVSKTKETIFNTEIMLNTYLEVNKAIITDKYKEDVDAYDTPELVGLDDENFECSYRDSEDFTIETTINNNDDLPIEPPDFIDLTYQCEKCDLNTDSYKQLLYHMRSHPDIKLYECEQCGNEYKRKSKYLSHMGRHRQDEKFKCKFCGKGFKGQPNLTQHVLIHKTERIIPCPHCDKTFCHMKGLRSHMLIHNEKTIECEICGKKFKHTTFLKCHIATSHNHSGNVRNKTITASQEVPCEFCGKILTTRNIRRHINIVHYGKFSVKCSYCVKGFPTSAALTTHMQHHINNNDEMDPKTMESYMKYKCDQCDKGFTTSLYLKKHKILHSGLKEHVCPHCSKEFAFKVYLERHIRLNHDTKNPKNFNCDICGKVSTDTSALKQHMFAHTGETPYHCKFCDSKFRYRKSLRIHIRNKHDTKVVSNNRSD